MELKNSALIVTGGCGGFGRPLVEALAREGARVGVVDINEEALAQMSGAIPGITPLHCELTNPEEMSQTVQFFFEQHGRIDGLVNNAGILHNEPLVKFSPTGLKLHDAHTWRKVMSLNLDAVFYMTSLVVEKMILRRTRGVVVNISSIAAHGNPGQSAYAASKAAVEALTRTWALELGIWGIRCTCVAPGYTGTDSTHAVMNKDTLDRLISEIPLRRLGDPREIVSAILFCLTNEFFNAKTLSIDGGHVL